MSVETRPTEGASPPAPAVSRDRTKIPSSSRSSQRRTRSWHGFLSALNMVEDALPPEQSGPGGLNEPARSP
jgi:hypothetical protein